HRRGARRGGGLARDRRRRVSGVGVVLVLAGETEEGQGRNREENQNRFLHLNSFLSVQLSEASFVNCYWSACPHLLAHLGHQSTWRDNQTRRGSAEQRRCQQKK